MVMILWRFTKNQPDKLVVHNVSAVYMTLQNLCKSANSKQYRKAFPNSDSPLQNLLLG